MGRSEVSTSVVKWSEVYLGEVFNEKKWCVDKCGEVEWSVVGWNLNGKKWSVDKSSEVEGLGAVKWEEVKCRQV
jgi:hypothetical protein